jgi:hypothetical protein
MNAEDARRLVPLYRTGKQVDSKVLKAVRFAEADATLRDELQAQMGFDDELVEVLHSIKPPEDLRQKLDQLGATGGPRKSRVRRNVFNPAILSAIVGVLLLIGFAIFLTMESSKDFPGKNWAVSLIDLNTRMTGAELEPTKLPAGELGDNMMLRGFDRFALPPELGPLPAVGWRVFRHSGNKVAQVAVHAGDSGSAAAANGVLVYVFRASDFGVHPAAEGTWKVFDHQEWTAAASERAGLCTIISFRGTNAEMENLLKSLKP